MSLGECSMSITNQSKPDTCEIISATMLLPSPDHRPICLSPRWMAALNLFSLTMVADLVEQSVCDTIGAHRAAMAVRERGQRGRAF